MLAAPVENGGFEGEVGDDGGEIYGGAVGKSGFEGEANAGVTIYEFQFQFQFHELSFTEIEIFMEDMEQKLKNGNIKYMKRTVGEEDGAPIDQLFFNDPDGFMICQSKKSMKHQV